MKDMKDKDWNEIYIEKMRRKRNFFFRAFVVNMGLILIAWLFTMMPWYNQLLSVVMHLPVDKAQMYVMDLIGFWQVLAGVLFLVPALAAWWDMSACRKEAEK